MPLLYHAYVYLEFLILACTIYILAPIVLSGDESFNPHSRKGSDNGLVLFAVLFLVSIHTPAKGVTGLSSDYFAKADDQVFVLPTSDIRDKVIPKLEVEKAAELLQMNHVTVRKGLQQGVFPWGYAIHTSPNRWVYFINAKRFAEIEGIAVQ